MEKAVAGVTEWAGEPGKFKWLVNTANEGPAGIDPHGT